MLLLVARLLGREENVGLSLSGLLQGHLEVVAGFALLLSDGLVTTI